MLKFMKHSLVSAGIKLSLLTLASRILGLVREMTKAAFLGTSALADAFGVAFMIPNLFRRLFAENSISVAFIPTFKAMLEKSGDTGSSTDAVEYEKNIRDFLNAVFTLVGFTASVTVAAGIALAPLIVPLFVRGDASSVLPEMIFLTRIMFPYLLVISVAAFFQGILNSVNVFTPSGFTPILFNLCVIGAAYFISPYTANPARAMAYGVTAGGILQALFQLPFVIKQGFFPVFTGVKRAFTDPGTRRVLKLIAPTVVGMAAYQLNDVVSTALAARAGEGIVSSLQYSLRLQELILGIFAVSVGTVILPDLSGFAKRRDWSAFEKMLMRAVAVIAFITVPVSFFSFMFGENIIILIYKSKRFSDASVALTLSAFRFHAVGLFFIALNRIIAPAFYAQSDTKSPTAAGIAGFAVNIALAALFIHPLKGAGIALALTLASAANTAFLFLFLTKTDKIRSGYIVRTAVLYAVKLSVFSFAALVPLVLLKKHVFSVFSHMHRFIAQGIPLAILFVLFAAAQTLLLLLTKDKILFDFIKGRRPKVASSYKD